MSPDTSHPCLRTYRLRRGVVTIFILRCEQRSCTTACKSEPRNFKLEGKNSHPQPREQIRGAPRLGLFWSRIPITWPAPPRRLAPPLAAFRAALRCGFASEPQRATLGLVLHENRTPKNARTRILNSYAVEIIVKFYFGQMGLC